MKGSKLVILIGIVLLLGAAFYFISLKPEQNQSQKASSELLFSDVDPGTIKHITITDGVDTVGLTLKDSTWTVDEKSGYPSKYEKIHELVFNILQLKPSQKVTDNEENYEPLGVVIPPVDKEGTVITFRDKDDQKIAELVLGKIRKSSKDIDDGQYIRRGDEKDVYMITDEIRVMVDVKNWLDRDLMDVKEQDVQFVTIKHKDESANISLSRKKKGDDFELASAPNDKNLKKGEIKVLAGELSHFRFDDVYPHDSEKVKDLSFDTVYTSTQFNGLTYKIMISEKDEKLYAKIEADYKEPAEHDKAKEEDKGEKSEEELKKEAEKEALEKVKKEEEKAELIKKAEEKNELFSRWIYELPSFRKNRLMKKAHDLWEDTKEDKNVSSPGADEHESEE
jgi:hypothetical protein